jgi:hypothetical protein
MKPLGEAFGAYARRNPHCADIIPNSAQIANRSRSVRCPEGNVARRLPITIEEAKRMTLADILEIQRRADARDGRFDPDAERKGPLAYYIRTRDEIRKRAKSTDCRSPCQEGGRA